MAKVVYDILVIGTGGTGSYFLKEFSRFLCGNELETLGKLIMCDGDVVEEHNIARQAFIKEDVGRRKASVLAEALNENFDVKWHCYPQYVTSCDQIREYLDYSDRNPETELGKNEIINIPVIIGCVDNHGCRLTCEQFFKDSSNCIYFDSANEFTSGEVVFSYKINGKQMSCLRSEIFPDIKEGDTRQITEMSCEELNVHSPQHIATNMRAGNILLVALCNLLQNNRFYCGYTFFDVENMSEEFMRRVYRGAESED